MTEVERRLRETVERATPGQWEAYTIGEEDGSPPDYTVVCASDSEGGWDIVGGTFVHDCGSKESFEEISRNNEHIAAACPENIRVVLAQLDRLRAQMPESMQHCTIVFKECEKGHGWLTATNWVQHGCPTCERDRLRKLLDRDHTGLAAALNACRQVVRGYGWIPDGSWGSYEYHERTQAALRQEVGRAFDEVERVAELALRESGDRAVAAFRPEKDQLAAVTAERDRLQAAVAEHHAQKADDRCWMDDDKLYAAAGLPPCDRRVGDKQAMLLNCARYLDRRCEGGGWPTYRELEAQNAALRAACQELLEWALLDENRCNPQPMPDEDLSDEFKPVVQRARAALAGDAGKGWASPDALAAFRKRIEEERGYKHWDHESGDYTFGKVLKWLDEALAAKPGTTPA